MGVAGLFTLMGMGMIPRQYFTRKSIEWKSILTSPMVIGYVYRENLWKTII